VSTRETPAPVGTEGPRERSERNLLAWILGPVAVVGFAALGFAGYWRARRAGLTRSRCVLRDTRLVLTYLAVLALAGLGGIGWTVYGWLT
jgi:hypothetical protein